MVADVLVQIHNRCPPKESSPERVLVRTGVHRTDLL